MENPPAVKVTESSNWARNAVAVGLGVVVGDNVFVAVGVKIVAVGAGCVGVAINPLAWQARSKILRITRLIVCFLLFILCPPRDDRSCT
jgi:hypothetical protein